MFRRDRKNRTPAYGFGDRRTTTILYPYILLSMNSVSGIQAKIRGIEPLPTGLEAVALPLYYISECLFTSGETLFTSKKP